ncbi:hypothetical protein MTsPCn9_28490 [Croceitalea sp. MTPC9]|uniref:T9SS type A sorting domain-containing protein n=1 Tax=unclassified Croceitalea TaxID=2632280 RepID=UPI002B392369|nr:hypothetical protein MTsPCn6_29980 [Croceitalea sp. MTPC6]GMN17909.1 hypothetical protein MTsPCn9_28490 [Croceitalea sp. MTPC9]
MKITWILFFVLPILMFGQVAPKNPWLADSPWPIYHTNSARQSYSEFAGPTDSDSVVVKILKGIKGGTSPWTYFSDPYPNGKRALLQSNATHFMKILNTKNGPRIISKFRIDKDWLTSFSYNHLQIKGNQWYTFDPKYNPRKNISTKLYKLGDKNPKNLYSQLELKKTFDFGDYGIGKTQHSGINYLGQIVFASDNGKGKYGKCTVGILSQDLDLLAKMDIQQVADNEIIGHNGFPVDKDNSFYLVTTHRLIRIDWDGQRLSIGFEAFYDFVNDGPTGRWAEGSGTTPSLMGFGEDSDKLVVMSDGHAKNNLVAFWREIPEDWKGIPGEDIRLAGKIQLPAAEAFSNKFQSIENSPTVYEYDVGIAQFNGFLGQGSNTLKGVQKIHWNSDENKFEIAWVNKDINMNGVLTYSVGSNLVYGSGREDNCNYYYYGLDWDTGLVKFKKYLGKSCKALKNPLDDGGCNNIIDEEGNIYYAGGASLVKLEIVKPASGQEEDSGNIENKGSNDEQILYPNPSQNYIEVSGFENDKGTKGLIFDISGQLIAERPYEVPFYIGDLKPGLYFLKFDSDLKSKPFKFLKQ